MKGCSEKEGEETEFKSLEGRQIVHLQFLAAIEGVGVVAILIRTDDQISESRKVC